MTTIAPKGPEGELRISAPDPDHDAPQLIDLICKTFAVGSGYWKGERICRRGYLLKSNYDWHASRVGKLGGEIITHFRDLEIADTSGPRSRLGRRRRFGDHARSLSEKRILAPDSERHFKRPARLRL